MIVQPQVSSESAGALMPKGTENVRVWTVSCKLSFHSWMRPRSLFRAATCWKKSPHDPRHWQPIPVILSLFGVGYDHHLLRIWLAACLSDSCVRLWWSSSSKDWEICLSRAGVDILWLAALHHYVHHRTFCCGYSCTTFTQHKAVNQSVEPCVKYGCWRTSWFTNQATQEFIHYQNCKYFRDSRCCL